MAIFGIMVPGHFRILPVLLILLSSCASLFQARKGTTPETAIVLDTIDLEFSEESTMPLRPTRTRTMDIVHMELDLRFDWGERSVIGKAKHQIIPLFQALDTLSFDARGFDIGAVKISTKDTTVEVDYLYDKMELTIPLAKQTRDTLTVIVDYVAHPTKLEKGEGSAITSSQGLYFINPDGSIEGKPKQIWTQGETEYNSGWFPCFDHPNEKYSQEIFLTVDSSFHTISNGRLVYSTLNEDGTRTDYWKQSMPHSTYLTMVAVGEFALVKDAWKEIPVWYYLDQDYEQHAHQIFGNTPEMLEFFSELLGYPYPWEKYHQIVVKDFVSGAMENTSAVIHGDFVQQTPRDMLDGTYEEVISHELFHHWFGDLVTSESWSQIVLNEGFATYGEYLWMEYKYGKDEAKYHLKQDLHNYLSESHEVMHSLIRHRYDDPDDVFDAHSYQKGGRVIHMLRNEVGDSAFFQSLKHYLIKNEYQTVELANLRIAFEEVTGRDLYWFFDQWFMHKGHPTVKVNYHVEEDDQILKIDLEQNHSHTTNAYRFHVDLHVGLEGGEIRKKTLLVDDIEENFAFAFEHKILWYDIDPEADILWEIEESKSTSVLINQIANSKSNNSKIDAMTTILESEEEQSFELAVALSDLALSATFWHTREMAVAGLGNCEIPGVNATKELLKAIALQDNKSDVRAAALVVLDSLSGNDEFPIETFTRALHDSSYAVIRTALSHLVDNNPCATLKSSLHLEKESKGSLTIYLSKAHMMCANPSSVNFYRNKIPTLEGVELFIINNDFADFALKCESDEVFSSLVEILSGLAIEDDSWWARYSAAQGLKHASGYYDVRITSLESIESRAEDETAKLAELRNKKASVQALLEEIEELQIDQDGVIVD